MDQFQAKPNKQRGCFRKYRRINGIYLGEVENVDQKHLSNHDLLWPSNLKLEVGGPKLENKKLQTG